MTPTHISALRSISESTRERMARKYWQAKVKPGPLVEVFPKPREGDVTEFSYGWTEPHLMIAAGAIPQSKWTRIPHEGKVK